MFFDRYEIHIQAFAIIPRAKLMSGDSSSLTFHDFKISSFYYTKLLQTNQEQIREHPGKNTIYGNMIIKMFEISEKKSMRESMF